MAAISHNITRTAKTDIVGSVDATLSGDGTNPINAADIVGGFTTQTVAFAAGDTVKAVVWQINPDSTVEPDEGYKITLTNPQPSGTLDPAVGTGKILNDDAGSGPAIAYGPTTTTDTGIQPTGSRAHKVATTWRDNKLIQLRVAMAGGTFFEMRQDSGTAVGFRVYTDGNAGGVQNFNDITAPPANGAVVSLEVRLKSGSTTEYEGYALYGAYSVVVGLGGLVGTSAQGQIWYTGDNTGEPFTISKS